MPARNQKDRRRERTRGFRPGRSVYLQIPASVAVPVLGLATLLTGTTDHLLDHRIWFGPAYLLICASAAWFVGSRFALALGLVIISFNLLTGNQSTYPYGAASFALNFALRFVCVLAVVLMLGLARRSLEREWRLARTDPLTGALNRQAFFEVIKADAGREGPVLLAYADVDGLKRLNDEMGHEQGDDGLRDFADRVRTAIRKRDLFARLGGDEFVILMKVKDEVAAKAVANRLNRVLNLDAPEDATTLKCSLGVLLLPQGSKSIDAELKLADKLMYVAKKAQAGLSAAWTAGVDGQELLSPPSVAAAPAGRRTAVRTRGQVADSETTPGDSSPSAALAA